MPIDSSSSKQGHFTILLVVPDDPQAGSAHVLSHLIGECGGDVNMSYLEWVCLQTMTFMNASG